MVFVPHETLNTNLTVNRAELKLTFSSIVLANHYLSRSPPVKSDHFVQQFVYKFAIFKMLRTQVFFHSFPRRCKVYQPSNLRESKFRRVRAGLWAPGKSNEPTPDDSDPWEAHPIEKYETAN